MSKEAEAQYYDELIEACEKANLNPFRKQEQPVKQEEARDGKTYTIDEQVAEDDAALSEFYEGLED